MLYQLSKLVPVRFSTTYGQYINGIPHLVGCRWWQWRDRTWRHEWSEVPFTAIPFPEISR